MYIQAAMVIWILEAGAASGSGKLLNSQEFWEPFDQRPSFKGIQSMPEPQRRSYFPLSRAEAGQVCQRLLWSTSGDFYTEAAKAFVAATPYPDIQRRFAARIGALCPLYFPAWVNYYDDDEEKYIDWVLSIDAEIRSYTNDGRDNPYVYGWFLFSVFDDAETSENGLAERAFWSLLKREKVGKDEVSDARADRKLINEFWDRLKGMGRDRFFWIFFGQELPIDVVGSILGADEGEEEMAWFLRFDDHLYIDAWSSPNVFSASPESLYLRECDRYYRNYWRDSDQQVILEAIEEGSWGKGIRRSDDARGFRQ